MKSSISIFLTAVVSLLSCDAARSRPLSVKPGMAAYDLNISAPVLDRKITGFTVIHGSAKSETVEIRLLESVLESTDTLYYFPEIDAAMAYYFNEYLETGDEDLLFRLIDDFRYRVPQEASVETYNKWRILREISRGKTVIVIGVDKPVNYRFYVDLLMDSIDGESDLYRDLKRFKEDTQTIYSISPSTPLSDYLKRSAENYFAYEDSSHVRAERRELFEYILNDIIVIQNLSDGGAKNIRCDSIMLENYKALDSIYGFSDKKQFVRMGIYHMMKEKFRNMLPGFMALTISGGIHDAQDIFLCMGLLSDSRVLWFSFDENGNPTGYTTAGGEPAGQGLPGVEILSVKRFSDITFFDLGKTDFIDRMEDAWKKMIWRPLDGKSVTDYLDAVILIHDSPANTPVEYLPG